MTFAVAKKPASSARSAERDAGRHSPAKSRSPERSTMLATPYIQRTPTCPCGGGCPGCGAAPQVQTKLMISQPGDRYEQEADRVAEQVMRMPDQRATNGAAVATQVSGARIQRCQDGELCAPCARGECSHAGAEQPAAALLQRQVEELEEEDEELLQAKASPGQAPSATPHLQPGIQAMRGRGQPLSAATRQFFEPRFGADFSGVRVHTGAAAVAVTREAHARAFTLGRDVAFGAGQYAPATASGRQLLAHELTHVVQQRSATRGTVQRTCGSDAIGTPGGCTVPPDYGHFRVGHRAFKFVVNCDDFGPRQQADLATVARQLPQGVRVEIHGYASDDGDPLFNHNLACSRALAAESFLTTPGPLGGGLSPSQITVKFNHGATPGPADDRRSVTIETRTPPPPAPCPPRSGAAVSSLNDYIHLIRCAETRTGFNPRQMLAMLRQMYYGKPWSATSKTSRWDAVIPCSLNLGHPRRRLGANLFNALHNSVTVQGVDIGHVFTGMEAMTCPRGRVVLSRLLPLGTVTMDNEAFATWGGDLGSTAASMAACWRMSANERQRTEDCGRNRLPMALPYYFRTIQAPDADLEGDIAAFVMRAAELGVPCVGSAMRRFSPSSPISDIFERYFNSTGPAGRTHQGRVRCFTELIGGQISGKKITNRPQLFNRYRPGVTSFATTYYVKIMMGVRGPYPPARVVPSGLSMVSLHQNSIRALGLFFDWLDARL